MAKRLLVGSVFIDTSPLQQKWLDLQLRFLKATTEEFDYAAFISEGKPSEFFSDRATIIPKTKGKSSLKNSQAHVRGLEHVLGYFKTHDEHERFLFLDMDSFPIRKGWLDILESMMSEHEIAIPLRYENLETRLHSSIIFAKSEALNKMQWSVKSIGKDLCGRSESDVRLDPYQGKRYFRAYPLLKSNRWSYHPLICTVYHDLFYHHCCGSGRKYNMRSRGYWDHIVPQRTNIMETIDELMDEPTEFISKLAGWNPEEYPKV